MDTENKENVFISGSTAPEPKKKEGWLDTIKYILIALAIVIPIRLFIAEPFVVSGHSMDPTFENGEYIVIDELSNKISTPTRGEVVVFKPPVNLKTYYIKRVIGLPGETISIRRGIVSITTTNGETITLQEPYIKNHDEQSMSPLTLRDDQYFVLGDNRPVSSDSRVWGPLPRENIVGTPFASLFPFDSVSFRPGQHNFAK